MEDYQQRVVDEKQELDKKREALGSFLGSERFSQLPEAEQIRMKQQAGHMRDYSAVLGDRIENFPVST